MNGRDPSRRTAHSHFTRAASDKGEGTFANLQRSVGVVDRRRAGGRLTRRRRRQPFIIIHHFFGFGLVDATREYQCKNNSKITRRTQPSVESIRAPADADATRALRRVRRR